MPKSFKLIVESLLFSSDKPLTIKAILTCIPDANPADIKSAIEVLKYEYESLDRSFELREVASGFQLRSRPEYGAYILRLLQTTPNRLSAAAMETLAIIAYKQPILRHEIEKLRGVDVGGILRTLLEKGLVKIMGRKDLPGKPLIYGTTKRFLEVFDLKDISSLPKLKEIKSFGSDEVQPTQVDQSEKFEQKNDEETVEPGNTGEIEDEGNGQGQDHDREPESRETQGAGAGEAEDPEEGQGSGSQNDDQDMGINEDTIWNDPGRDIEEAPSN